MNRPVPSIVPAMFVSWFWLGGSLPAQFLYVANSGANSLSGYTVSTSTGVLTPIIGSPFLVIGSPFSVAAHPSGRFVYATGFFASTGVNGYIVNLPTGALSPLSGSPFPISGSGNFVIAIQPSGKFAYVTTGVGTFVSVESINSLTGALSFMQTSAVLPLTRRNIVIHPSGNFVYMTQECVPGGRICDENAPNTVQGYAADSTTGSLTPLPGSPYAAGSGAGPLAIDPTGSFLYVGNAGPGNISAYTINQSTGVLTAISGSPFAPGITSPLAISIAPQGGFLYVSRGDAMIWGYKIDPTSGALTQLSGTPWGDGQESLALAVDCTSRFVYAADFFASSVSAFQINAQTGALTAVPGSPFPAGDSPLALAESCAALPVLGKVSPSPDVLWPPNHQFVDVTISYTVSSAIPAVCNLSVSSNEPGSGEWEVVDSHHVLLRADRNGNGSGRTYTVTVDCTNSAGSTTGATQVTVPHDLGK